MAHQREKRLGNTIKQKGRLQVRRFMERRQAKRFWQGVNSYQFILGQLCGRQKGRVWNPDKRWSEVRNHMEERQDEWCWQKDLEKWLVGRGLLSQWPRIKSQVQQTRHRS